MISFGEWFDDATPAFGHKRQTMSALERARAAIAAYFDTANDLWLEDAPLREGLNGITPEDALVLMQEAKELGSGDNHRIVDEIVAELLPEPVRDHYRELTDGPAWWYA